MLPKYTIYSDNKESVNPEMLPVSDSLKERVFKASGLCNKVLDIRDRVLIRLIQI